MIAVNLEVIENHRQVEEDYTFYERTSKPHAVGNPNGGSEETAERVGRLRQFLNRDGDSSS